MWYNIAQPISCNRWRNDVVALQTCDRQVHFSAKISASISVVVQYQLRQNLPCGLEDGTCLSLMSFFSDPPSPCHLSLAARHIAQALFSDLLLCLLLSTTFASRLLASCFAPTFARLVASMLARTLASALASCLDTRLVALGLASTSSTSCHLNILGHGLDCIFRSLIYDRAVPDSEFPFKSSDPDVPEEGHAKDC